METKTCSKCHQNKPLSEFAKNKSKSDGLSYICKCCQREYVRDHYRHNRDYYKKKARRRDAEITTWFQHYKSTLKCEKCGESHISCLEFHHLDSKKKTRELGRAVNDSWSKKRLMREINKCSVLCSNCHRKLHYEQRTGPKSPASEKDITSVFEAEVRGALPRRGTVA